MPVDAWLAHVRESTDLYNAGDCVGSAEQLLAALRLVPDSAPELFSDEELRLADNGAAGAADDDAGFANLAMSALVAPEATSPTLLYLARALRTRWGNPEAGVAFTRDALQLIARGGGQLRPLRRPLRLVLAEARRGVCDWQWHEAEERWLMRTLRRAGGAGWRQLTAVLVLAFPWRSTHWLTAASATMGADACCQRGSRATRGSPPLPLPRPGPPSRSQLRIAIVSADIFGRHVLAHLMHAVWSSASAELRPTAFALQPPLEAMDRDVRAHIARHAEVIELHGDKPRRAARRIAATGAQLLLWISEPGEGLRALLKHRPAPAATHHLAVPATTGAGCCVHYFTLDARALPPLPDAARFLSERAVLLPAHYQVNSHARGLGPLGTAALSALPAAPSTECIANFGQLGRLDPLLFDTLLGPLLQRRACLWLSAGDAARDTAGRRLRAELAARGVRGSRLDVLRPLSLGPFAARAARATLYVDTLHYNSHTTTVDVLWAGLPSLTAPGGTIAGRVGGAAMSAVGIPTMAAASLRHYTASATMLLHTS